MLQNIGRFSIQKQPPEVFCKKMFLRISENSQEKTLAEVSFLRPATLWTERPRHRCFPVNFVKVLKAPFFTEHFQETASDTSKSLWVTFIALVADLPNMFLKKVIHYRLCEMEVQNIYSSSHFFKNILIFRIIRYLRFENTVEKTTQLFSCEFCEIFENTFFYRTSPVAASVTLLLARFLNPP